MLLGGYSIIVAFLMWAAMDRSATLYTVGQLAFAMAFVVNHPHFLASYILLYRDFRKNIFKKLKYFWAAAVVPIILLAILGWGLLKPDLEILGQSVNAMYFFVGWHYVKQVFGCVIVTSVQRRIYYKTWEKRVLLANLFTVWMMSWTRSHIGFPSYNFYGIPHHGIGLPALTTTVVNWSVALSFAVVFIMQLRKYIIEGVKPSPPGVAAFVSLYVWYLPTLSHPGFGYLIPMFHSLQYIAFVWLLKKNQVLQESKNLEGREWRLNFIYRFGGFVLGAIVLGALAFEFIPKTLDNQGFFVPGNLGSDPILAVFLLFINIHHYFIDNVIWKSDNEIVRKYLFTPSAQKNDQEIPKLRVA